MPTTKELLAHLCSPEFNFKFAATSTARAVRDRIRRTNEFQLLQKKRASGELDDNSLRVFVNQVLSDFKLGEQLFNQPAVCMVAVLLEESASNLAEEFLYDLASVAAAELCIAREVGRLCLTIRVSKIPTSDFEIIYDRHLSDLCGLPEKVIEPNSTSDRSQYHAVV